MIRYLCILFSCINTLAYSQSTYISNSSGDWNTPSTWNVNSIPTSSDDVLILPGDTVSINSGTGYCNNITIDSTAFFNLTHNAKLVISGNWYNSGTFGSNKSLVKFTGALSQTISGTNATTFYNLEIKNNAGVIFGHEQTIRGTLTLTQGTLNTSGYNFIFISDSNATAAIAEIQSGADIIGNITMQRYLSSNSTGWRLLGSPVNGTTIQDWSNDFITSGFPGSTYPNFNFCSVYTYDETVAGTSDFGFVMPAGITQSVIPGNGYWAYIGPTPLTIDVTGTPEKFNHTFPITYSSSAGPMEDGWNLISNPYPSPINWDSPAWTKTGVNDAIYIWDPSLNQYSSYVNGIGVNGGTNIITSSQAFWIQTNQSNPVLNSTESTKTNLDVSYLHAAPSNKTIIKLSLTGNGAKDETGICFSPLAINTFDPLEDAIKFFSGDPLGISITSMLDTIDLAINSVPSTSYSVALKVKVGITGQYTINRDTNSYLPLNTCIYLEDLATNTKVNLENSPYTFAINDTTSAPRFILHVGFPLTTEEISTSCSYKQNGQAIVNVHSQGPWNVTWKNAFGNILASHPLIGSSDTLNNLSSGVYSVVVSSNSGVCSNQVSTILISAVDTIITQAVVSNVICKNDNNGSIQVGITGGNFPFSFHWSTGANTSIVNNLAPGIYTLIVTDANGCSDTTDHLVQQISSLDVNFSVIKDTIFPNTSISFLNTTTGQTSLSWDFGDGSFNTANYYCSHSFSSPGQFTIELIAYDKGCSAKSRKEITVLNPLNISSGYVNENQVLIYSSGNNAYVVFNLADNSPAIIEVYTLDGRLVGTKHVSAFHNTESIPLGEDFGVYLLRVMIDNGTISKKIVK